MKEKTYLIIVILIIIGLIVLGTISFWPTFWPTTSPTPAPQKIAATNQKIEQASASIGYKVNVSYPKISGLTNTKAQSTINSAIKSMMTKEVNEFTKAVSEADKTIPVTNGGELIISNKVDFATDNAVSVWFQVMKNVPGMAHPWNYNLVYNYDVGANKVMQISDLFVPESNWVQTLSDIAKNDIIAQPELQDTMGLQYFADQGAGPKAENFKLFNISDKNLILIFDPATVAPDFAGTRTVKIPWSKLSSILNFPPTQP